MFRTYANEGDSIIDHISKLCTHWNMLSTLSAPISNEMFTILVSASLPDSWDSFTRLYFGNKVKATVTSQELIGLVVDKAKRLTMREKEIDTANQTRPFNNNRQPQNTNLNVNSMRNQLCQNCDRTGHTKADCWAQGGGKEGQYPRQQWRGRGRTETVNRTYNEEPHLGNIAWQTGMLSFDALFSKEDWLADSGTSSHIATQH